MDKNGTKKEVWYNFAKLESMGYSKNALNKRFYRGKMDKYGIEWHQVVKWEKAVSRKNYLKFFKNKVKKVIK